LSQAMAESTRCLIEFTFQVAIRMGVMWFFGGGGRRCADHDAPQRRAWEVSNKHGT
jgi:hypothetical protein